MGGGQHETYSVTISYGLVHIFLLVYEFGWFLSGCGFVDGEWSFAGLSGISLPSLFQFPCIFCRVTNHVTSHPNNDITNELAVCLYVVEATLILGQVILHPFYQDTMAHDSFP